MIVLGATVKVFAGGKKYKYKTRIPVGLIRCGETDGPTFREFVKETRAFALAFDTSEMCSLVGLYDAILDDILDDIGDRINIIVTQPC